ncbi:MAG: multiple sugar transport system permease protein [Planctomycetota bacterium]|jgi:multiple sugar transport system permease protein
MNVTMRPVNLGTTKLARQQRNIAYLLLAPAVIILLAFAIYPLVFAATLSFRVDPLYNPNVARFIGWRNYSDLFENTRFWASIRLTLFWAITVVTIQMVLGFLLAIVLDSKLKGAGLLRSLIIIPVFVSPIAMGLNWRFIFEPVSGLANWVLSNGLGLEKFSWLSHADTALMTLMIVDCWQWVPFVALILLAGMQSISPDILEAARLDRIRGISLYTRIVLPLMRPVIMVVILIRLVDEIRMFDLNFIMTQGGPGSATLLASTYDYTIFKHGHLGLMAAYGFLILILINLVVGVFLNTLYRSEKAARQEDTG